MIGVKDSNHLFDDHHHPMNSSDNFHEHPDKNSTDKNHLQIWNDM